MPDAILPDLLPCPFCRGKASRSEGRNGDGTPFEYIECDQCRAMAELDWWNRRTVGSTREALSRFALKMAEREAVLVSALLAVVPSHRGPANRCWCGHGAAKPKEEVAEEVTVPHE